MPPQGTHSGVHPELLQDGSSRIGTRDSEQGPEEAPHYAREPSIDATNDGAEMLPILGDASGPSEQKKLTFLTGLALVVSLQVGSGIFAAPSQVTQNVPSAAAGLLVWLLAGLLVWTGAASFIELGLRVPENGGVQEYLRHCYGDFMACSFTWTWVGISRPSSMALITGVFAEYACRAVVPHDRPSWLVSKVVGLGGLWVITVINFAGARAGARMARIFFWLKLAALLLIVVIGLIAAILRAPDKDSTMEATSWGDFYDPDLMVGDQVRRLVDALFAALFCYAGWETIGFILGDMANPRRDLPRILQAAMFIVVTGFILVNVSLYLNLPLDAIRTSPAPVLDFAYRILGVPGIVFFSLIIAVSCLGALNTNIFATAALCVTASRRGYFPQAIAPTSPGDPGNEDVAPLKSWSVSSTWIKKAWRDRQFVPINAMIMNSTLASLFFVLGTFRQLVSFKGISEYFFFLCAVAGVFILRRAERSDYAPVPRTAIWNPVIFISCSAFIVVRGIISNLAQGLALAAMILISYIIYRFRVRQIDSVK